MLKVEFSVTASSLSSSIISVVISYNTAKQSLKPFPMNLFLLIRFAVVVVVVLSVVAHMRPDSMV